MRILILTTLAGIGHHRAAWAIEEGIKKLQPEVIKIRIEDPLAYLCRTFPFILNYLFLCLLKTSSSLWGVIYENEALTSRYSPIRWLVSIVYGKGVKRILRRFPADVIACTHVFATCGVGRLKSKGYLNLPLISISTDYHYHPMGINDWVDIFVVPCEEVLQYLTKKGVPKEKIRICGISISPKFYEDRDREALRKRLKIEKENSVVLIMGGGFGIGPLKELIRSFSMNLSPLYLLIVAGKNSKLRSTIQRIVDEFEIKAHVFGFVDNIEDVMEMADIVITKPGGLSISEALAKGLPLIITEPVKGQEMWNVRYLLSKDVAIRLKNPEEVYLVVSSFLNEPWKMAKMRENSKKVARPYGAIETAKLILESVN